MGRLFQKTDCGDVALAFFAGGRVRSGKGSADTLINYNGVGEIYQPLPGGGEHIVANCDSGGNIRKNSGSHSSAIAVCEDGVIFKGRQPGGRILAHFDGDMYGAAAAVVAVVLKMGDRA